MQFRNDITNQINDTDGPGFRYDLRGIILGYQYNVNPFYAF